MTALRKNLLSGRVIALSDSVGDPLGARLGELGARTELFALGGEEEADLARARAGAPLDALVHDCGPMFADGGQQGLLAALEHTWSSVAAVANGALIPAQAGKVVLIGPRAASGPHVEAARVALQNLARTLSVEWARYGITTTAILPGEDTTGEQVATLVAFLLSAAGDYFSGCSFTLGRTLR